MESKLQSSCLLCSLYFTEDCFEYGSDTVGRYKTPKLNRDETGITAVPSALPTTTCIDSERTLRMQRRGKVQYLMFNPEFLHFNL